ncbi:uncharacterized protein [Haliaeetus albicilla]|uniref:uncharacterized protein isoform X1 n=1 Tax=Haliaeetus albicilla TaxID=8969 RepID=UPI0037E76829
MFGPGHVPASQGQDHPRSKAKRRWTPALLPQTVVPSPSFCCSPGLCRSPHHHRRAPQVEGAQTPGADTADMEDWRVLGEDKPQGLGTLAHLGLAVGWRGPSTPWTPLPVALSQTHSHRAPGWETRMAWGGRGTRAAGRRDCSGQLGRLCDMPVPLCPLALSLQLVQDRSRAEEYLSQSLPYLGDAQATLREVAVRFIGLAARPLRDQSREKLAEIDRALQPMQEDSEPAIGSLALQTIFILNSPRVQQTWGRSLRALCCGCC